MFIIEQWVADNVYEGWEPTGYLYPTYKECEEEIKLIKNIEREFDEPEWNGTKYRIVEEV